MSNAGRRDRTKQFLGERLRLQQRTEAAVTPAEYFLTLGKIVKRFERGGVSLDSICRRIGLPVAECLLARLYAESPDSLKLRALVEKWSWQRIMEQVRLAHGRS